MKERTLKSILLCVFLGILFLGIFYRLSNKKIIRSEDEKFTPPSAVEVVLERNLSTNYPSTPKEVVKYFSEITQCYYNETLKDEDIEALANQALLLYDDELVGYKTYEDYILDLKADILFYNTNGYTISSYAPSASTDVFYYVEDGHDWARLYCVYTIKSGKQTKPLNYVFVLRKDENSHWRIYGWEEADG